MASIAVLGAGPVGCATALLTATLAPNAELAVFDAGRPNSADRTFFIPNGTWEAWQDLGLWRDFAATGHAIKGVKLNFARAFGGLRLDAGDCQAEHIGYSFAERQFIGQLHKELGVRPQVRMHAPAQIVHAAPSGMIRWRQQGRQHERQFDLVAICGLASSLLVELGFAHTAKQYAHAALATTFAGDSPGDVAYERILASGAATLIPRRGGWGHVLLLERSAAAQWAAYDDEQYLQQLRQRGLLHLTEPKLRVLKRGQFYPQLRKARNPAIGRLALLGSSACTVHPVGAQELNLGLRDALSFAHFVSHASRLSDGCAGEYAARRRADRSKIAALTDGLALLLDWQVPCKLPAAALAATAIGMIPPLRSRALGCALYHGAEI